jgi:hypothetical protein
VEIAAELVEHGIDAWLEAEDEDAALSLLLEWLDGAQLTERADEADRRLEAADDLLDMLGDEVPAVHRYHARAVLALPEGHERRDAGAAIAALFEHLEAATDADEIVYTIAGLLDADEDLLDEGEEWAPRAEAAAAAAFARAADAYCARRWIDGDEAEKEAWAERNERYLPAYDEDDLGSLAAHASFLDRVNRWEEAADVYGKLVERGELGASEVQQMGVREAELRLSLGDDERSAEALARVLPHVEASYLTAVLDEDLSHGQGRLDDIAGALAVTRARLGDWDGVLRAMDRASGLRGRYRAALRLDGQGQDLLALERELDFATRGEAGRAELLEGYRHLRARLDPARLASVSVEDVAAVLEPEEAVVSLRFHFAGSVAVAVVAGEARGLLLEDFGARQWLELFAEGEEFLTALVEPWAEVDPEPGLARILEGVEDLLGDWLGGLGVRRLTLVPDRMLHLIPWAALPSLRAVDVVIAPSVSEAIRVRSRAGAVPRDALVVANPTLDLRVSAAACGPVAERLTGAGFAVSSLAGAEASEDALLGAVGHCTLLHFAGHGRAGGGLELHPHDTFGKFAGIACRDSLTALDWLEHAENWRDVDVDEDDPWDERIADVPDGRLVERRWHDGQRIDRRLERPRGTLVATWGPQGLVRLSELLSPTDLMLVEDLGACRLAVLVACSSGSGLGGHDETQAGLPIALQLAGIDTVVATRWEVDEGFAALWADEFYAGLTGDIAALVRRTGERLAAMSLEEARERLLALADRADDPIAAMELEAYAYRLTDPPFAAPSQWAAFFLTGRPTILFGE